MTIVSPPSGVGQCAGREWMIAVIALVLALVELAADAEQVAPAAATPVPTMATPAPTPESTTIPSRRRPRADRGVAGTTAWTIVLESSATRRRPTPGHEELRQGMPSACSTRTTSSLEPDRFLVFSGQSEPPSP